MNVIKFLLIAVMLLGSILFCSQDAMAEEVELSGKELKTKSVAEVATLYQIDANKYAEKVGQTIGVRVKTTDTFQLLHDNYGAEPSVVKEIAVQMQTENGQTATTKETTTKTSTKSSAVEKQYNFIPITIALLLLYVFSFVLSRFKVIGYALHKKIWNWLLLGFFLASAILGCLLVLRISNGIIIPLPFNMLYWHVEAGIAMTAISIFHIMWHWKYFTALVKRKKIATIK